MWRGKISFDDADALRGRASSTVPHRRPRWRVPRRVPPVDFALHDTYWVVSHLHFVLFGGIDVRRSSPRPTTGSRRCSARGSNEGLGKIHFVLMFDRHLADLLPHAPARPGGHAAPHRRLLAGRRMDGPQLRSSHGRRVRHRDQRAAVPVEHLHHAPRAARRPRRPVGRLHAGVGDHQPAAAVQLRRACRRSARSGRCSTSSTATTHGARPRPSRPPRTSGTH